MLTLSIVFLIQIGELEKKSGLNLNNASPDEDVAS
jgi:hypothetical protein